MNKALRVGLLITSAAANLSADVTYTKSVRYTGGTMLSFLRNLVGSPFIQRLVGADIEAAFEDQSYTIYVKGSKMAQVAGGGSTIYDLDTGTITTVDTDKQTYSIETFDELRAQIERAQQWMKRSKSDSVVFDVQAEKTNQTRVLDGRTATKTLITLTAQSESAWGRPVVGVTSWLIPVDANTRPLYDFAKRAAAKLSSIVAVIPSFFGAAGEGPGNTAANLQKLNGISMLDEITVTGVANPLTNLFRSSDTHNNAPVITLEAQSSHFSFAPVDTSRFAVPAGYRQEHSQR